MKQKGIFLPNDFRANVLAATSDWHGEARNLRSGSAGAMVCLNGGELMRDPDGIKGESHYDGH